MNSKVFILGIDAATFDLMLPWMNDGKLPAFEGLAAQGTRAKMLSTVPVESATAWSSMMTGTNPGKHGVFAFSSRVSGTYNLSSVNFRNIRTKTLFELASEAGKRVVGVSIPLMYPAPKVNGILISGLLSPTDRLSGFPDAEIGELNSKFSSPKVLIEHDSPSEFVGQCRERTDTLFELTRYMLKTRTWDLFMLVSGVVDETQHVFWGDMTGEGKYGNVILEMYQKFDTFLGELKNLLPTDTYVLIVSDHGQGPMSELFCTNIFLEQAGYLQFLSSPRAALKRRVLSASKLLHAERQARSISRQLRRKKALPAEGSQGSAVDTGLSRIDWPMTKAYSFGRGIYVNLKGREPDGTVSTSSYESVRTEIIQKLREFRGKQGDAVLDIVARREEIFSGSMLELAPDIVIESDRYTVYGPAGIGEEVAFGSALEDATLAANHKREGVLLVSGPGIRKANDLGRVDILDVAPTVLYLLDISIPRMLDGKIITQAFAEEFLVQRPPMASDVGTEKALESFQWSKEDEKKIREHLHSLGYI